MSVPLLRLISRLLWVGFRSNLVKMLELWSDIVLKFHCGTLLGLCAKHEPCNGLKGLKLFFFHFYMFQSILSRSRHTFFFEDFCNSEAQYACSEVSKM